MLSSRLFRTSALYRPLTATSFLNNTQRFFHASRPAMTVHVVKTTDEFEQAVKSNKVVLVDCFAEWCGPCKAIAPILEKSSNSEEFKDKIHFIKFDVDDLPEVTEKLGVRAMPTFFIFKDGEKADEFVGAVPTALTKLLQKHAE